MQRKNNNNLTEKEINKLRSLNLGYSLVEDLKVVIPPRPRPEDEEEDNEENKIKRKHRKLNIVKVNDLENKCKALTSVNSENKALMLEYQEIISENKAKIIQQEETISNLQSSVHTLQEDLKKTSEAKEEIVKELEKLKEDASVYILLNKDD